MIFVGNQLLIHFNQLRYIDIKAKKEKGIEDIVEKNVVLSNKKVRGRLDNRFIYATKFVATISFQLLGSFFGG